MSIHGFLGGVISATAPTVNSGVASGIFTLEEQMQAAGTWPVGGYYLISRSVRIRASASAYFSRTPSSATNRSTWTFSAWIKKAPLDYNQSLTLLSAGSFGSDLFTIQITDNGLSVPCVAVYGQISGSAVLNIAETPARRDPSAWFHLVVVLDTTQATASNRLKLYYNGAQVTALTTATYPNQNTTFAINNNQATAIGSRAGGGAPYYDGYLTEINFIDGQALTPASFGVTDSVTGVWNPIRYSGTYGNNGFYLNFKDPTSTTTIGYDYSGNSNNWTANNISVTAGTTYDSMVDVPIGYGSDTGVGGTVRGNYAVVNPLSLASSTTLSEANLKGVSSTFNNLQSGTVAVSSGKWYWELTFGGSLGMVGIVPASAPPTTDLGYTATSYGYRSSNGNKYNNGSATAYGNTYTTNDVIGVALDLDNGKLFFSKNNTWQNSGDPAAGTNAAFTGLSGSFMPAAGTPDTTAATWYWNFGQRAFSYTAPSGFKALCTQNLPAPTISNGANYNASTLYTGTGASQTVSNAVNSISFQPDFVWMKSRSAADDHILMDSVRGTSLALFSNLTNAEVSNSTRLTSFNSNGFTLGTSSSTNTNGATYVGWQWKGGGTAVSNTAGTITSSVSANTTAGFSVVGYTGSASAVTVGHGLGVAPSMVIVKARGTPNGSARSWFVYHTSIGATKTLYLNLTDAAATTSGPWNNTAPTSTVFSLGTEPSTNWASNDYVAYCFAPITGYSAFGSYTGNGSTDGPFVFTNMRPRYILIKRSDSTGSWYVWDTSRSPYNQATLALYPNLADAEPGGDDIDFVSNGFKMRDTFSYLNASGGTYIYAAFAENPFTIARAR